MVVMTCDFSHRAPKFTNIIQPGSKVNYRDQCAKQIHAFERSKVMSLAKIESDIEVVDRRRMLNKLNV